MATNYHSTIQIHSLDELDLLTKAMIPFLSAPLMVGLDGGMGSGKTTFVRSLGTNLGSKDWINSPTYSIIQQYDATPFQLIHIDLYRTHHSSEIDHLDIPSLIDENSLVFIEWIDKTTLFTPDILIKFKRLNELHREIQISSTKFDWIQQIK